MAPRTILIPFDFQNNEIRNVRAHLLAADPGAPVEGQFWFNTTDNVLRYHDGTSVVTVGSGDLAAHLADASAAHAAAAISYAGGTGLSATDVEAAIDELATEKANLAGGATFTGAINMTGATVTVPTASPGDNDTSAASTAFVAAAIAALVDAAPGTLDTLNELAAALGDDPNFATTLTNALALKTAKYATLVGTGAATSIVVTHNLNTRDVVVSVHDATTFAEVEVDVVKTSVNTITLGFSVAPASNAYRVTVIG